MQNTDYEASDREKFVIGLFVYEFIMLFGRLIIDENRRSEFTDPNFGPEDAEKLIGDGLEIVAAHPELVQGETRFVLGDEKIYIPPSWVQWHENRKNLFSSVEDVFRNFDPKNPYAEPEED